MTFYDAPVGGSDPDPDWTNPDDVEAWRRRKSDPNFPHPDATMLDISSPGGGATAGSTIWTFLPPTGPTDTGDGGRKNPNDPVIDPVDEGGGGGGGTDGAPPGWSYQGSGFQPPTRSAMPPPPPAPPPPPDFNAIFAGMPAAPDFAAIAAGLGSATMGPQYQTAEGSFQGEEVGDDLVGFMRDWMSDYNPYASQLVSATRAAGDARLAAGREEGMRGIEEHVAARGLIGSDVEGELVNDLTERVNRERLDQELSLAKALAEYELAGRQGAGNFGLGVGEFKRGLGADRRDEGRYSHEADRTRARDFEDDQRARVDANLRAAGMQEDSNQGRARIGLDAAELGERSAIDRAQIEQRANEIQIEALLRGREIDLDEARAMADDEYRRNALEQRESQFGRDLGLREQELAEQRKRNEFLEDLAILDYYERTQGRAPGEKGSEGIGLDQAPDLGLPTSGLETGKTYLGNDGHSYRWISGGGKGEGHFERVQ